ncbi:unnamed protein product [Didymodactylos carnosus]|uniref:Uncharacterized protein n=1 Tax=Didymodactylos carnosus TaxID=1234261 RepID=A0A814E991_9BILA|nr:unnamed protein product [Didymodactylos carnosus]CAF3739267.1 unnamed protein product [Didymodactylos carnosus]
MFSIDTESIVAAFNDRIKAGNQQNHPALIQVAMKIPDLPTTDVQFVVLFFQIFISTTIDNKSLPDKVEELLTMIFECEREKLFCGEPKDEMTSLKVHYKNNLFQRGELKAIFDIRELFHGKP